RHTYTLSLHDALPISVAALPVVAMGYRRSRTGGGVGRRATLARRRHALRGRGDRLADPNGPPPAGIVPPHLRRVRSACRLTQLRSEEHTSELQSRENL